MNALLPKNPPLRSKVHRQAVSRYRCLVCAYGDVIDVGETVSQAAHLSWAGKSGTGYKATDALIVPLCPTHHRIHDGEPGLMHEKFWEAYHIDPLPVAKMLWERHGD